MFIHERKALKDVIQALRGRLHGKIVSAHAFGAPACGAVTMNGPISTSWWSWTAGRRRWSKR